MKILMRQTYICLLVIALLLSFCRIGMAGIDTSNVVEFLNSDSARKMHPSLVIERITSSLHDTALTRKFILKIDNEGFQQRNLGNYQKALFFHQTALTIAYRYNLLDLQARILNNLGVVYRRLDNYEPALHYHLQALKIAEMINSRRSIAIALNSIGNINYMMGKYDDALKYFLRGYIIEKESRSIRGMAINLNNIGNVYKSKGDTVNAIKLYKQSLQLNSKINDLKGIGICHNDIGTVYQAQGNKDLALNEFMKAYEYFKQTNDLRYIAEVTRNIGKSLLELNQTMRAGEFLKKSLEIARQLEAKWEEEASTRALAEYYHITGDNQNAYYYSIWAHQLRDKIDRETAQKNISNAQALYMLEKVEKEKDFFQNLSILTEQKLRREKQLRVITTSIVLIVLIAIIIILDFRKRYTRNLTEKNKQLQDARDELKNYSHKLENALDKAQAAARAKNIFLANISHEFRTPLNSIVGFSSLLKSRAQDEEQKEILDIILNSANNLIDLITELLNISAIETGQLKIKHKPVDLKQLLRETEKVFRMEAQQKSLDFALKISPTIPEFILSDEGRLRQVLFNLTGNAVKFTDKGSIEIEAWCEAFQNHSNKNLYIRVKDTGPGIPQEELESIFEPFFQGKSNLKESEGMGLGLSIVKKIVGMLGGEIKVESEIGKGSVFLLIFNNIKEAKIISKTSSEKEYFAPVNHKFIKALVVDDLEFNRMLIAKFLDDAGITALFASNGEEALEKAKLYRPAMAFVDIRMPGMDGFEFARRLRELPEASGMILIAVTASVFGTELDSLAKPPFDAYILKPVDYNSFQQLIRNYFPTYENN
jgi:signal transduction histidine kinase/Flp pilus assembly protein TadD